MTVVQKIIEEIKGGRPIDREGLVKWLYLNYLKAEEQQIRDAYEAGAEFQYREHFGGVPNAHPNLETYLTHLKTKA